MTDICRECANPAWTGKTIEAPAMPSGGEGGTSNFNALENRPKYDGVRMTGNTNIPDLTDDIERVEGDIDDIQALIPELATPENQLADKDFVNSSVATNTANFVGTYDSLEELEAVENPSNNDYGFVISTDEYGNTVYNRYKYVASLESWEFEYALNNSSFTAAQWATINSGLTSGDADKIRSLAEIISVGTGLQLDANGNLTAKLYNETGNNTDAPMNQKAASDAIDAVYGHARVLTEADYNYHSSGDEDNQVNPWFLPPGIYSAPQNITVAYGKNYTLFPHEKTLFLVTGKTATNAQIVVPLVPGAGTNVFRLIFKGSADAYVDLGRLLSTQDVINTLTSTSSSVPLSAAQGKALSEMIGTLSNLNTTAKTNAVAAINEVAGYKGQARVLTTNDYNWNSVTQTTTGTLDTVALWLLEPGLYAVDGRTVSVRATSTGGEGQTDYVTGAIVTANNANVNGKGIVLLNGEGYGVPSKMVGVNATTGRVNSYGVASILIDKKVVNNLTSTDGTRPLSANQGKVLKGLIDEKQDKLTAGNGIEIDNENVISIATISTEDWSALWQ